MSKVITTQYSATCLTCEERIEQGEEVNWEPGVGIWHKDCQPPRNLERYKRDIVAARFSPSNGGTDGVR